MNTIKYSLYLFAAIALGVTSCKKDFINPGATPVDDALTSSVGLTGVALGLQKQYSFSRVGVLYNQVTANGFSTFELRNLNTGNTDELNLSNGGAAVDGNNAVLNNLWATNLKVIFDANNVINGAQNLGDKGYASGLIAYATIWKALAYGSISMYWEQIPDTIGDNVTFVPRIAGFAKAVAAINKAQAAMTANPISAAFLTNLPAGIEIPNTLQALKARYLLFSQDYTGALAAANTVSLTVKSTMNFDAITPNPIFNVSTATNNVFQVIDSTFGLPIGLRPTPGDPRIPFYMSINATVAPRWRINGFGASLSTPWPIYLPGEMLLIKAECLMRAGVSSASIAAIEAVRMKTPASDVYGIGGNEGPLGSLNQAAYLQEIYRQRCIELYMQGFKLEDSRRFGRSNTPGVEKNRNFYPYPFKERDNNPNAKILVDPAF